jgi:hypothetical protein
MSTQQIPVMYQAFVTVLEQRLYTDKFKDVSQWQQISKHDYDPANKNHRALYVGEPYVQQSEETKL